MSDFTAKLGMLRESMPTVAPCGARDDYEKVLRIAGANDDEAWQAKAYSILGLIYKMRGELAQSRDLWFKSIEIYMNRGVPQTVDKVQAWLDGTDVSRPFRLPSSRPAFYRRSIPR